MTLRVHIDRLTVEGMTPTDARDVGEALQRHLTRLARAEPGRLPSDTRRLDRLDLGVVPPGASPASIGRHVATQIFQGLSGPRRA